MFDVIIPAAGKGTRMFPITHGKVSKLMLPIKDKPLIQYALEEAIASKANNIHLILNKKDKELLNHIKNNPFSEKINVLFQKSAKGIPDALSIAKDSLAGKFFGVIFPDTLIDSKIPALLQVKKLFEKVKSNVIGLSNISKEDLNYIGTKNTNYEIFDKNKFRITTTQKNSHLISRFILSTDFFAYFEKIKSGNKEISDYNIISEMSKHEAMHGCLIEGTFYDLGIPKGYLKAIKFLGQK